MIYQATNGTKGAHRIVRLLGVRRLAAALAKAVPRHRTPKRHEGCRRMRPVWYRTSMPNDVLSEKRSGGRRFAPLGIIFGLAGLLLFAYFVSRAGVGEIISGIQRLGAGFILILAVSSIRYIVRALAWVRCVEPPYRLPFRDAFAARLMGDALGNIVPFLSVAVSEPSKAVFVKDRVPLIVGLSGLAIENIFYALSVALFIFAGTATLLLTFSLPKGLRYASIAALVVTFLIIPIVYLIVRRQTRFLSGIVGYLGDRGVEAR